MYPQNSGFKKDSAFDKEIKDRFGELCISASRAELASWRESIEGRLGEIIILDQFSRNIWRDTPKGFAQDNMALILLKKPFGLPEYLTPDTSKTQISDHAIYALRITKIHQDAIALFSQLNDDDTYQYELRHKRDYR